MLTQELLTEALYCALKVVEPQCGRFCTAGASIEADTYTIFHNGAGSFHTSTQTVYAKEPLAQSREQFTGRLKTWIDKLHRGEQSDLNT